MKNQKISNLKLISSREEVGNVKTFVFETGGLKWIAGQNQGYILGSDQRWFTISSAPSEGTINISTRISQSVFKQTLNTMKPGDKIQVFELNGDFTWEEEPSEEIVMVAGGIGITPFRSILLERQTKSKHLNTTLLYFNRTDEIPFLDIFKKLEAKHPEFTLKTIVGRKVTADKIIELAPAAKKEITYLSGPEPMVESIGSELRRRAVKIKQDWFPGYDEKNY